MPRSRPPYPQEFREQIVVTTWAGFIYLTIVLDVWSRRVVGWSIGERMTGDLVSLHSTWLSSNASPRT